MTLEELAAAAEAAQEKALEANNAVRAAWQAAQNLADAARALVSKQSEPVATIFMDQHGRQQIEFITTIPVGETIRLYAIGIDGWQE
jgi:hypothetical protein